MRACVSLSVDCFCQSAPSSLPAGKCLIIIINHIIHQLLCIILEVPLYISSYLSYFVYDIYNFKYIYKLLYIKKFSGLSTILQSGQAEGVDQRDCTV